MTSERDKEVIVSYSHADASEWVDACFKSSKIQTTRSLIHVTKDSEFLREGEDFREGLRRAFEKADGVVVVLSKEFLASTFVNAEEWGWIEEFRKRICWVQLGPIDGSEHGEILAKVSRLHSSALLQTSAQEALEQDDQREEFVTRVRRAVERLFDPLGLAVREMLKADKNLRDVEWLCDGAFTSVYTARGPSFGKKLVVKVPRFDECHRAFIDSIEDAERVAQIPNFMSVFEVEVTSKPPYCVCGFSGDDHVSDFVERREEAGIPASCELVQYVLLRLAHALRTAHRRGLPHLNIRSSNIVLQDEREPLLTSTRRRQGDLTRNGVEVRVAADEPISGGVLENLAFRYPAPPLGQRDPSAERIDVYQLGLVGYHMLSGRLPGTVRNAERVVRASAAPDFARLESIAVVRPDCSLVLAATITAMIEPGAERGFDTFEQVIASLTLCPDETLATAQRVWAECAGRAGFFKRFYKRLFVIDRSTRKFFPADWTTEKQRHLLRDAVLGLLRYYELHARLGVVPSALNPLQGTAARHADIHAVKPGKEGKRIKPRHIASFRTALAETVEDQIGGGRDGVRESRDVRAFCDALAPGMRYMRSELRRRQ